jgi:hypothetical protein
MSDVISELNDLRENYPQEFDRAVNSFKGEMGKIWDFWKDVFGFRRGGRVQRVPHFGARKERFRR